MQEFIDFFSLASFFFFFKLFFSYSMTYKN